MKKMTLDDIFTIIIISLNIKMEVINGQPSKNNTIDDQSACLEMTTNLNRGGSINSITTTKPYGSLFDFM